MLYECRSIDTISNTVEMHFEFQMYRDGRDATGADFDGAAGSNRPGAEFGVFRRVGSQWVYVKKTVPQQLMLRERVEPNEPPCLIAPPGIFVERGVYSFDIELDIIDSDYMIAYQRCCRSESISNLVTPGDFGAVFAIELTPAALRTCNNSPVFNEFPPLVICAGFELEYDHSASDIEGDSITYGLCTPLSAGGNPPPNQNIPRSDCELSVVPDPAFCGPNEFDPVQFRLPTFNNFEPLAGNPAVGIDPVTGLISGVPNIIGEHVMAVCANEYRDGVLLSTIRRDFQFIVSNCEKAVDARIASDRTLSDSEFEVISCGDFNVRFTNQSVRLQDIQEYAWEFDVDGDLITSSQKDPTIEFPGPGVYNAKMIVNPGISNCTDSAFLTVRVFPDLEADFEFVYDTCVFGPTTFTDLSTTDADFITDRRWNFGDGVQVDGLNPVHFYRVAGEYEIELEIEDNNGCTDTERQPIIYAPAPNAIIVEPSVFIGCEPAEVFFDNLSEPINDTYDVTWDFGDGSEGNDRFELNPTHIYEEDGTYDVSVTIVSPIGCESSRSFDSFIQVQKGPDADFRFAPEEPTIFQNEVFFTNLTTGAIGYFWDFDGDGVSFDISPSFEFRDTGRHVVTLQATSSNGCLDTVSQVVDVIPLADVFFPNAFTPNNNGRNEVFRGVGNVNLINDYSMNIYDRWGKVVFATNDPNEGWNGRLQNSGELLPMGVYMYLASYRVPRGDMKERRGFATLVR